MARVFGRYTNKMDKKGRVSVPKIFRDALTHQDFKGLYAFSSFKNSSIEVCSLDFMNRVSDSLDSNLDLFSDDSDDLADLVMGMSHALNFDPEGRITLPADLISHAGLVSEVLFVGKGSRLQIWEPSAQAANARAAVERAKVRGLTLSLDPSQPGQGGEP